MVSLCVELRLNIISPFQLDDKLCLITANLFVQINRIVIGRLDKTDIYQMDKCFFLKRIEMSEFRLEDSIPILLPHKSLLLIN